MIQAQMKKWYRKHFFKNPAGFCLFCIQNKPQNFKLITITQIQKLKTRNDFYFVNDNLLLD